eukprot:4763215-Alexandrium_andersonii.AAC.3
MAGPPTPPGPPLGPCGGPLSSTHCVAGPLSRARLAEAANSPACGVSGLMRLRMRLRGTRRVLPLGLAAVPSAARTA